MMPGQRKATTPLWVVILIVGAWIWTNLPPLGTSGHNVVATAITSVARSTGIERTPTAKAATKATKAKAGKVGKVKLKGKAKMRLPHARGMRGMRGMRGGRLLLRRHRIMRRVVRHTVRSIRRAVTTPSQGTSNPFAGGGVWGGLGD